MIKFSLSGIKKILDDFAPEKQKKIITRTLNKIGAQAKTEVNREVRRVYNISKERVDAGFKLRRASWENMELVLSWKGQTPGLQQYGARQVTKSGVSYRTTKSGAVYGTKSKRARKWQEVSVEVKKGRRKVVKGKYKHGGFIAANPVKGGIGIFERKGTARLPIARLSGPDVPGMVNQHGVSAIEDLMDRKAQEIFNHEFEWEMGR